MIECESDSQDGRPSEDEHAPLVPVCMTCLHPKSRIDSTPVPETLTPANSAYHQRNGHDIQRRVVQFPFNRFDLVGVCISCPEFVAIFRESGLEARIHTQGKKIDDLYFEEITTQEIYDQHLSLGHRVIQIVAEGGIGTSPHPSAAGKPQPGAVVPIPEGIAGTQGASDEQGNAEQRETKAKGQEGDGTRAVKRNSGGQGGPNSRPLFTRAMKVLVGVFLTPILLFTTANYLMGYSPRLDWQISLTLLVAVIGLLWIGVIVWVRAGESSGGGKA